MASTKPRKGGRQTIAGDYAKPKSPGNKSARDMRTLENLKKVELIVTRRRQALTWEIIAEEMAREHGGPSTASGVWKLYQSYLRDRREKIDVSIDDWRDEMTGQIEAIMRGGLYQRAQKGELPAIREFRAMQESLRKLRGIDAPTQSTSAISVTNTAEATPEAAARAIREAFGEHGVKKPLADAPPADMPPAPSEDREDQSTNAEHEDGAVALPEKPPA